MEKFVLPEKTAIWIFSLLAVTNLLAQDPARAMAIEWIRSRLMPLLGRIVHWHPASVVPLLFGTGVTMALTRQFVTAYICFVLLGIYLTVLWLTSKTIQKKEKSLTSRHERKRAEFSKLVLRHRWLKWGTTSLIIAFSIACIVWTRSLQTELTADELSKIRDNSLDHLEISPWPINVMDNSSNFWFSIVNGAHPEIAAHTFQCLIHGFSNAHTLSRNSAMFSTQVIKLGMLGGGRGESAYCHSPIKDTSPMNCIDVDVGMDFALKDQPKYTMHKYYRFVGFVTPTGFKWTQESPVNAKIFC